MKNLEAPAPLPDDPRQRLIAAAGPVFAENGYSKSTLREICSSAGVNVAAVSYYFGDKMGLYREVINHVRTERERRFPAPANSEMDEPKIALWRLIRTMLSRMLYSEQGNWETQLLMREMNTPTPAFAELVNEFFRPLFNRLNDAFTRLLGVETPTHVVEQLTLSAVGQCLYYRVGQEVVEILIPQQRLAENFDLDSLSQHITAVMITAAEDARVQQEKQSLAKLIAEQTNPETTHEH